MVHPLIERINFDAHKELNGDDNIKRLKEQAIEELAEAIVAIQHLNRRRVSTFAVIDEFADVVICIGALLHTLGDSKLNHVLFDSQVKFKVERFNQRLREALDKKKGDPQLDMFEKGS